MASRNPGNNETVAAKMPASLIARLDRIALYRGKSRSSLIREIAEAAADGRILWGPPNGPRGMSLRELGASDVGRAAALKAQVDAEAACRGDGGADGALSVAPDVEEIALAMARRVAEGRCR
jgi:hypothetical protein